jgi:hypothetical protein
VVSIIDMSAALHDLSPHILSNDRATGRLTSAQALKQRLILGPNRRQTLWDKAILFLCRFGAVLS